MTDALRALRSTPIVTAVAILSLALGIGANAAIFSIVNALLLRSLPVKDPQQLVQVLTGPQRTSWSNPLWEQLRDRDHRLFDGAFAYSTTQYDLARGGEAQPVHGMMASGEVFDVLGVPAILGRTFGPDDDLPGGGKDGPVAVISYGFWQRHYGGDPHGVGSHLSLDGADFAVIGVTAASFTGVDQGTRVDVMVPIGTQPLIRGATHSWLKEKSTWWLRVIARLRPDQTIDDAVRAVRGVQPQMRAAVIPDNWRAQDLPRYLKDPFSVRPAANGPNSLGRQYQQPLYILMAIVGLVLLIACANIANLLLARGNARRHEMSVRLALGASAWRIARQLIAESLTLATAGAALGLVFAGWGARLMVRELSVSGATIALDVGLDWRVLAFTTAIAAATALLFGTLPALRAARVDPGDALKTEGRAIVGESRFGAGSLLVVGQVALSLVLVVGAGLFMRTFAAISNVHLGFEPDPMLEVDIDARHSAGGTDRHRALFEQVREAVAAVPGVQHAALERITPVTFSQWDMLLANPPGLSLAEQDRDVFVNAVSPEWFAAYGTPLAAGRDFTLRDDAAAPRVAIVNETFAKRYFPSGNPVGKTTAFEAFPGEVWSPFLIVGVARDAVYDTLRAPVRATLYLPVAQLPAKTPVDALTLAVRSASERPELLTRGVVEAVQRVDRTLTLRVQPMSNNLRDATVQERLLAMLSGFFGGLALLLAGIGLYGIMSYTVGRRRTEIGIRMALGAGPASAVTLILLRVAVLVGLGIGIGAALSLWASQFVGSLLFHLPPRDPATLAGAALVLAVIGTAAAWLPARRAARIDPAQVLREG
ncbi:MAG: ABC transporter permease [Vicinamibacterales bacterium]